MLLFNFLRFVCGVVLTFRTVRFLLIRARAAGPCL